MGGGRNQKAELNAEWGSAEWFLRSFDHLQLDAAVGEGLLRDGIALLACFDFCLLHGVDLQEAIQVSLIAPEAANIRRAE